MTESRFIFPRYFKPGTFISLALCVSAAVQGRVLLPDESAVVSQGDIPESWTMASGSVLTVNSGAQALGISVGGPGAVLNLNAGSSTQSIDLTANGTVANITGASIIASSGSNALTLGGSSAILTDASVVSANGLGLFGSQAATGPGSSFLINGGNISGGTGGASLSFGSVLDATGAVITGTGANSYGIRGFGSAITLRNSTVSGGLNGILYRVDTANVREGTVTVEGTHVEGGSGAAIRLNGQGGGLVANLNLLNGTTLTGGNGNALEIDSGAVANVLLQASAVEGDIAILTGSNANLAFNQGQLIGNISADATSSGTLGMINGSVLTGDVTGIDSVLLDASAINGNVTSATGAGLVALNNGSTLNGNISSDNVSLDGSAMTGDITSTSGLGVVSLANRSTLNGNISSDNVTVDASGMTGTITSTSGAGVVSLNNGSALDGNIVSNTVSLVASRVTGDITSTSGAGVMSLANGSTLTGNILGDNVSLDASGVTGTITSASAAGVVSFNNRSVVEGNVSSNNLSLDASAMTGDITAIDAASTVSLANNSVFTGNLVNVDSATIAGSSVWNLVGNSRVNSLAMNEGVVSFGEASQFYQLDVANLSGNGTFIMDVDYLTNQHDTLNVTGSATGSHTLQIAGSGVDPASPQPLTVVHTDGGDATFALSGAGVVDVGTYSYALNSAANGAGTDWFLDPGTRTVSPGTRSVLALFNTAPTVWYGELTSLRSRMGELRFNGGKSGGWVRTYGNKYNVNEASGVGYQQSQQGLSLGADAPLPIGDGQWLVGVLAGHSTSDLDLTRGTSGMVKSYYAGVYTTWLDQASGYYFDGVLKYNRFRNDSKVSMSDGTRSKGDYDNGGVGGSVEFGRHIKLDDGYFVEPFTQLSAVVIGGKDYDLDNGMQAKGDRTRSLLGKVGVTAGRNFTLDSGSVVQPYVRVAGAHEFAKNNEVQVNNNVFNNDLSGSRGELGAGVAVALSDRLQLHADFDYSNGENIEQPFGANVGLRYSW
ncbi:autotransporter outer membrane beta-barrel domain-containing protein [Xanthomonas sp. WHRI 1810A]|uniref:autotransporter outer membrane beta-barrel domain-containing protein n=1 Tax=Xanthomonas sp. WHRI 1810A TaxID=3161565 RepID=UPI0032E8BF64